MTSATTPAAHRRTKTGIVLSDKCAKTIVVNVEQAKMHPKYGKSFVVHKKYHAHDEASVAKVGDTVLIEESRPLSATKRWKLTEVLKTAA